MHRGCATSPLHKMGFLSYIFFYGDVFYRTVWLMADADVSSFFVVCTLSQEFIPATLALFFPASISSDLIHLKVRSPFLILCKILPRFFLCLNDLCCISRWIPDTDAAADIACVGNAFWSSFALNCISFCACSTWETGLIPVSILPITRAT
jgi:hypothetical protein